MTSEELLGMLNQAIARELQAASQFMWQHVQWRGDEPSEVGEGFRELAAEELKHAETLTEWFWRQGGEPTVKPNAIQVGSTLEESLTLDIASEYDTIGLYKMILETARAEGDLITRSIVQDIEREEEGHHDFFVRMLEKQARTREPD